VGKLWHTSRRKAVRRIIGEAETASQNFTPGIMSRRTQPVPGGLVGVGARHFRRWMGVSCRWVKDAGTFTLLINARADAGRNRLKSRPSRQPSSAAMHDTGGRLLRMQDPRGTQTAAPFHPSPRFGEPMGLAGLTETWIAPPNGEETRYGRRFVHGASASRFWLT